MIRRTEHLGVREEEFRNFCTSLVRNLEWKRSRHRQERDVKENRAWI
jgi:hypothetical protein